EKSTFAIPGSTMVPTPALPNVFGAWRSKAVGSNQRLGPLLPRGRLASRMALGRGAREPAFDVSGVSPTVSGRPVRKVRTPDVIQPAITRLPLKNGSS